MFFNPCLLVVCNILIITDILFVCCTNYRATSVKIPPIIVNSAITSGSIQFSSVQFSPGTQLCSIFATQWTEGFSVYHQLPELAQTRVQRVWWCHPTISPSVISFSSCPQSFPASESFPMSQLFASGSQSIGASASASVLPMNIQDSFALGLTGWISLQSKGLSRVFSSTTVQKHQFFNTPLS